MDSSDRRFASVFTRLFLVLGLTACAAASPPLPYLSPSDRPNFVVLRGDDPSTGALLQGRWSGAEIRGTRPTLIPLGKLWDVSGPRPQVAGPPDRDTPSSASLVLVIDQVNGAAVTGTLFGDSFTGQLRRGYLAVVRKSGNEARTYRLHLAKDGTLLTQTEVAKREYEDMYVYRWLSYRFTKR